MSPSVNLTPTLLNLTLTTHGVEYSQALPAGCQHFTFQCRTAKAILFAFVTGKVAGPTAPYATLASGAVFRSPEKLSLKPGNETVYFASGDATDGLIVELVAWT